MNTNEIKKVLDLHKLWLESNGNKGERANLRYANLRGANLRDANLRDADLRDADLTGANLRDADLTGANLYGANLLDADLRDADLRDADLEGADLTGTILEVKKEAAKQTETACSESNLRSKFDELAKSLGLEIVSLKVKQTKTFDL
jgi:uncharacterized protein YjbI with pentapeptide repeats